MPWGSTAAPAGRHSHRCPGPCGSAWRSSSPRDRLPRSPRPARRPPARWLTPSPQGPRRAARRARGRAGAGGALSGGWSRVPEGPPGARDTAAGVVGVRRALDAPPADAPVGVIFPDAEELGLLGAGVLARERANLLQDTVVVNFDGLDDRGATIALVHRPGPIVDRVVAALGARRRRWPVLVDGIALARAARECVTIMRGDWGTARVVHTPRDTADRLTLEGSRDVAEQVARALSQASPGGRALEKTPR